MNDPLIGSQIGPYRVERILGVGGMASVYFAWDTRNDRPVALKVMDERYRDTPAYVDRFVKEAQAIASWNHPNIVRVYDAGEENGIYYYAMEFIRGMDLAQLLRQYLNAGQLMPYNEVVRIGWAIANALDFAHAHGIIHRDVKPSNVLISVDGRILLSDFGLVMDINRGTMGETFGSPAYISPEQARSSAGAVPQSDLYSLGVMLYEMLIGVVPFYDTSPAALALKHLTEEPPRPRLLNPRLNPAVEAVLLRALRKQPADRYATGREMMSALEHALHPELNTQAASQPLPMSHETQVFRTTHAAPQERNPAPAQNVPPIPANPPGSRQGYQPSAGTTAVQGAAVFPSQAQTRVNSYTNQYSPTGTSVRPAYVPAQPPPGGYNSAGAYPAPAPAPRPRRRSGPGGWFFGCLGALLVIVILAVATAAAASSLRPPSLSFAQLFAGLTTPAPRAASPTLTPTLTATATRTGVPTQTPVPPTATPLPTSTLAPTATATNPPTATPVPTATATNPPAAAGPVYYLVLAHQKQDGFVLINTGNTAMPLAPLALLDNNNNPVVSGADWGVDTLQPNQCVGVFLTSSSPKIPSNVKCDPTGKVVFADNAFWKNPVNVQYNGAPIAICALSPSKCGFNTQGH